VPELSKKMILCAACTRRHQIGTLDAIATHWYVSPSGCADGDYWVEGDWHFVCPATGVRNRLLFHQSWEERDNKVDAEAVFKRLFRNAFKSMTPEHEHKSVLRKSPYEWVNNEHVDKHREAYGLPEWIPAVPGKVRGALLC
jgi:hypothetical protein